MADKHLAKAGGKPSKVKSTMTKVGSELDRRVSTIACSTTTQMNLEMSMENGFKLAQKSSKTAFKLSEQATQGTAHIPKRL